jgi:hypothetical protein
VSWQLIICGCMCHRLLRILRLAFCGFRQRRQAQASGQRQSGRSMVTNEDTATGVCLLRRWRTRPALLLVSVVSVSLNLRIWSTTDFYSGVGRGFVVRCRPMSASTAAVLATEEGCFDI